MGFLVYNNMENFKYPEHLSCKWKKKYDNIDQANDAGKLQMFDNEDNILIRQLYIYQCDYCNKYHLTQQETEYKVF